MSLNEIVTQQMLQGETRHNINFQYGCCLRYYTEIPSRANLTPHCMHIYALKLLKDEVSPGVYPAGNT